MKLNRLIQALILDDELDACKNLESYLKKYWQGTIEIMGIAQNTLAAEQMMGQIMPDVIFIDIEMPGENAFQFFERVGTQNLEIIFVTAYDEYALRALKLNAIDYILKPISYDELEVAIVKLIEKLALKESLAVQYPNFSLALFLDQIAKREVLNNIVLKDKTNTTILAFEQIIYLTAKGSYTLFVYEENGLSKEIVMSQSLSQYEDILPKQLFYRAHKSYLINGYFIKKVVKIEEQWHITLKDNNLIPISRRRHVGLVAFLKDKKF